MITLGIIFLSASGLAVGFYSGFSEVAIYSLQIFGVYCLCCIVDCIFGFLFLGRTAGRTTGKTWQPHPLTFVGRLFFAYQETVVYKLNTLAEQLDLKEEPATIKTPQSIQATDKANFFEQSLSELDSSFSPISSVLICYDEKLDFLSLTLRGLKGKRLEEQIKLLFADFFRLGDARWLGLQDTLNPDFPSEEISALGIRYLLSDSFKCSGIKGIVCLGFEADRKPGAATQDGLTFFAKDLERELGTLENFEALKSRANQAENASEARSLFLTHISHDIRSPLNNVKAILSLLKEDLSNIPDGLRLAETALRNCDAVAELVDSLIDFAKHRSGKLEAKKEVFDLRQSAIDVVAGYEFSAKAKGLELSLSGRDEAVWCNADPLQIKRVINNLVGNAIKYTSEGRVSISVNAIDSEHCAIRVADSGPGLSENQLGQIFSPFSRFDDKSADGFGLGLALSKILTEVNGGELQVRSEIDLGTVFVMALPAAQLKDSASSSKVVSLQNRSAKIQSLEGLRILVVDDDKDTTDSMVRYLKLRGAEAACANSVSEAIGFLKLSQFQVLITDCKMPDGGGRKLVDFVLKQFPQILIIINSGDETESRQMIEIGVACAMQKPVDLRRLDEYLVDMFFSQRGRVVGE